MLLALRAIDENIAQGRHLYESAQAIASLATYYYGEARWLDGWAAFGQLRRLIVPLGLHMPPNEASGESDGNRQSRPVGRMVLLFDAVDDVEREEGRAHLWTAVIWDATQASKQWDAGKFTGGRDCEMLVLLGNPLTASSGCPAPVRRSGLQTE